MLAPENVVGIEIAFIAAVLLYFIFFLLRYLRFRQLRNATYVPKIDERIEGYLSSIAYFKLLSGSGKMVFIKRVRGIANTKKFRGMHGHKVTEEMKVRLSATLVQLTYGLPDTEIRSFRKILIFPDTFFNPTNKVQMKGFTSPTSGTLAVSWPDFVHGYTIPDDNYNLGLHELAHALHINAAKSKGTADFKANFKFWTERSLRDFYNLKENREDFFREYGGTNFHEFFAVVVEHFFESPRAFFETLPRLYIRTCALLNQNPLNKNNDYKFDRADFKRSRLLNKQER